MSNLTTEKMLELAELVYPEHKWLVFFCDGTDGSRYEKVFRHVGYATQFSEIEFKPDLNGEDWQLAQACRVIVAFMSLAKDTSLHQYEGRCYAFWHDGKNSRATEGWQPNILQAACLALLGSGG